MVRKTNPSKSFQPPGYVVHFSNLCNKKMIYKHDPTKSGLAFSSPAFLAPLSRRFILPTLNTMSVALSSFGNRTWGPYKYPNVLVSWVFVQTGAFATAPLLWNGLPSDIINNIEPMVSLGRHLRHFFLARRATAQWCDAC